MRPHLCLTGLSVVLSASLALFSACSDSSPTVDPSTSNPDAATPALDTGSPSADSAITDGGTNGDGPNGTDAAGLVTGSWQVTPSDGGAAGSQCTGSSTVTPGVNCSFNPVSNRYVGSIVGTCDGQIHGIAFQLGGPKPTANSTRTVATSVLSVAPTEAVINYVGPGSYNATSGSADVAVSGSSVTVSFTNVPFAYQGLSVTGTITCP